MRQEAVCFQSDGQSSQSSAGNNERIHHEGRTKGRGRFIIHNRYSYTARWGEAFPGDDVDFYTRDGFVVAEYMIDRPELETEGIACWRARIEAR